MSPPPSALRISQLGLAGEGAWPDLQLDQLSSQLNVLYGGSRSGKSSIAQLIGHLLYGRTESRWRQQFAQTVSNAEGSVRLEGPEGDFFLRRHFDGNRRSRLTIASGRGDTVDSQTIQNLLAGLSPTLAAKLYLVDFAESPRADWLLSDRFAREFSASRSVKSSHLANRHYSCCVSPASNLVDRVDRQRIDELVKRRDTIASDIQLQMSVRRKESDVLESEINEADSTLQSKRTEYETLQVEMHRVDEEIAGLEARLRYFSLDLYARHSVQQQDESLHTTEIAGLDAEITRCRQTIADLQQRESIVRTELATYGADGTADSVTCLADGRATLGTLEQLLDELDAEVSQLARAHEPGRCIGHDSHAKLSPVANLLRQQVYTLCGQLTEQQRFVRRQQLSSESRQLARVQVELGERLDLLLSRRESLIQSAQQLRQPAQFVPQPPATDHCRCEHHGEFVQSADSMVLGRADRGRHEADLQSSLNTLHHQRSDLLNRLDGLQRDIQDLQQRWEDVQRQRAGLIGAAAIEEQKAELERLESVIHQALRTNATPSAQAPAGRWRASDILAQLTNGKLVQIRLERNNSQAVLVDRQGHPRTLESLSASEHDQLYLALTLSLVGSYAQRGIQLPLILDEPFLQQNTAQALVMLGVLEEFARAGHQVLVFTEERDVQRRAATLSATLFDLETNRHANTTPTSSPASAAPMTVAPTFNRRIVRETYDGHSTPVLRLAPVDGDTRREEIFYLTESDSFDNFPVLGSKTSARFGSINIHTIGDLLAGDAVAIARQLDLDGITSETVRLWQNHMVLMCFVPNLPLDDAQILAASGIHSPEDLFETDIDTLQRTIEEFLGSDRGRRYHGSRERYTRSRLSAWRDGAHHYRDRWRNSSRRYSDWKSRPSSHRSEPKGRAAATRNKTRTPRESTRSQQRTSRSPRFYLSRDQDVEDAPSIGPKTAERLAKVGIRTVADLLEADPESTASELDVSHVNAATLAEWQHQARLVCRIPKLRGYGAQLLVACGMTQPEQIAGTSANDLIARILSYCETKEGQRILRSGDPPKSEKIAEWVELARQCRPLEAA